MSFNICIYRHIELRMTWMWFGDGARFRIKRSMDHRLVASTATGSISSALLWILKEAAKAGPEIPPFTLDCPSIDIPLNFWLGLICGFLLWPMLELLVLVKQWLVISLRARIAQSGFGGADITSSFHEWPGLPASWDSKLAGADWCDQSSAFRVGGRSEQHLWLRVRWFRGTSYACSCSTQS